MNKYEIIRELGSGSYGKVYLARTKRSGEQVAVKEIKLSDQSPSESAKAAKEVNLLKSLKHPHIVRLIDSVQDKNTMYIVMEYVDGGDLAAKIRTQGTRPFKEDEILDVFVQLVMALDYIHGRKIVHRDIKPQNVFLTKGNIVKLGDFGVARALEGTQDLCQTVIGTPYYLSPEVWNNEPYNGQTDIWSLGCILYEMCALKRPFSARDANQLFVKVLRGSFQPIPAIYSKNLKNLVNSMLKTNPSERITTGQILRLPFIRNKLKMKLQESENKLNSVNIIVTDANKQPSPLAQIAPKHPVTKSPSPAKKMTAHLPKLNSKPALPELNELPLPPDEEAPRWATERGPQSFPKAEEVTVNSSPDEFKDLNDLKESINELQKSISLPMNSATIPAWVQQVDQKVGSADEIPVLRKELRDLLKDQLFEMLHRYVIEENDIESSAQFVTIIEEEDPETVEKMRKLVQLENMNNSK